MNRGERRRLDNAFKKEAKRKPEEIRYACPFPGCGRPFFKDPNKTNACDYHRQFVSDVIFTMTHFKPREQQPAAAGSPQGDGPKLFIPKPGMSDQAIKEARDVAGKGK